jgi:hypothetical protein
MHCKRRGEREDQLEANVGMMDALLDLTFKLESASYETVVW